MTTPDYTVSNLIALGLSTDRIQFVQGARNHAAEHEVTPEDARQCIEVVFELLAQRQVEREQHAHILNKLRAMAQAMRGFEHTVEEALDVAEGRTPVSADE